LPNDAVGWKPIFLGIPPNERPESVVSRGGGQSSDRYGSNSKPPVTARPIARFAPPASITPSPRPSYSAGVSNTI